MKKILYILIAIMLVVGIAAATTTTVRAAEIPNPECSAAPGVTVQFVDSTNNDNLIQQIIVTAMRLTVLVFALLATRYVIPWLKEKGIYATIQKFVQAAEKLCETGEIGKADKKQLVWNLLKRVGIKENETTDALIESAVKELDRMEGKLSYKLPSSAGAESTDPITE